MRTPIPPRTFATAAARTNEVWGEDWAEVRALWPLEPTVDHLNHGSFGAVPIPVLDEQQSWRARMEENPDRFFLRELPEALEQARVEVARFLSADLDGVVFVPNATTGVSTALASLCLEAGDEVVLSTHAYGAVRHAAERAVRLRRVRIVVIDPGLDASDADLELALLGALTERTRLCVLDDVTSPTARRLPLARLVPAVQDQGVPVLVDAAHGPGMHDVDLGQLDPAFWTGNLHKWCCAPRGSAVLAVAAPHRLAVHTLAVSWGEQLGFPASFAFGGTDDQTAWLAAPRAVRLLAQLGWERVRAHNARLSVDAQRRVGAALGLAAQQLPAPAPGVSMQLIPLPPGVATSYETAAQLQREIAERIAAEVAVTTWAGRGFVRVSAHAYNAPGDYDRLCAQLPALL